jgi:hypothetical protein
MAHDIVLGKTRRDWSCGSLVLPAKQEKRLLAKVDDVRYDVRRASSKFQAGLLALSAAVGLYAVSEIYRTSREPVTLVRVPKGA